MLGDLDETTAVTLDLLQSAAGELTLQRDGGTVKVGVPLPGRADESVNVRLRPCGDAWLLDDAGDVADRVGDDVGEVLDRLRSAGTELTLVDGAVTSGPWETSEVAPAVLRFAMTLGFLPTVAALADGIRRSDLRRADRGTSVAELWNDEPGDWGSESSRESAQQFQEDTLRRWAG